jgi:hypothetical protein
VCVHLQLLHAAVVSFIVETTFARHISAGGMGGGGGQDCFGTRAICPGGSARATGRKNRQDYGPRSRCDWPENGATCGRDVARDAPSPGDTTAETPEDAVNASWARRGPFTRPTRSPANSPATRDAQGLQRLQRRGRADPFAQTRAVRVERSPFVLW